MMTIEKQLRERIDELEEEVRQLRELLVPVRRIRHDIGLSPQQARVVAALCAARGAALTINQLIDGAWRDRDAGPNAVKATVWAVRQRLAGLGVRVHTAGGGYMLTQADAARLMTQ